MGKNWFELKLDYSHDVVAILFFQYSRPYGANCGSDHRFHIWYNTIILMGKQTNRALEKFILKIIDLCIEETISFKISKVLFIIILKIKNWISMLN